MAGVLVPLIIFASITAWVLGPKFLKMWHEQRLKEIEARTRQPLPLPPPPITAQIVTDDERKQLEERLRTLETIVCSVDYELNAKLNRLASRQIRALPPAPDSLGNAPTHPSTPPPGMQQHSSSLAPGQKLAHRFLLERRLGEGGMGSVWLARDEKLGEPVALKVIKDSLLADPSIIERFKREVSAARRVQHANVVRLHDLGEEGGQLFLSMEYVEGESLADRIKRRGPLPLEEVRTVAAQMCDALEAAHGAGVIHRDLKPANVLLSFHGPPGATAQVKVIDFGVAKLAHLEGMTATSLILGTPEYMAPEQIRGKNVDARTDLYALGMILHEALTGKTPFRGDSPIAVGFAACTNTVPPLRISRADVTDPWDQFVRKVLSKEPDDRFPSAADMKRAIPSQ
ncbi:MAG: serine/threonine-protein kinase [Polyangiales bacterium]